MADTVQAVLLNRGLDLVTPPIMIQPGALIDCLNYEMTDTAGYRRIDGYERYGGFPNGAIYEFYRTTLTAAVPAEQVDLVPGSILSRELNSGGSFPIGVIVASLGSNVYDVISIESPQNFVSTVNYLLTASGDFIQLQSNDLLAINDVTVVGDQFFANVGTINEAEFTVDTTLVSGKSVVSDPQQYLDLLRQYSQVLRATITGLDKPIAGLYWFDDRLLAAVNALEVDLSILAANPQPVEGGLYRWAGLRYRMIKAVKLTSGVTNTYKAYLSPTGDIDVVVTDSLTQITTAGVAITTVAAALSATGGPSYVDSSYASLGYYNNPDISASPGFTYLPMGINFNYDAGQWDGALLPPLTLEDGANPSSAYYVVGDAGASVIKVRLTSFTSSGGDFTLDTGVGSGQLVPISLVAGTRDFLKDNDEIHSTYPTNATSRIATVNGTPTGSSLAGTGLLRTQGTRYVWNTYNFFGQAATVSAYGTTGTSRAFWANENGYGVIYTQDNEAKDIPKYVSFHAGRLALGFAKGSVLLSASGEPYNFQGLDGAQEIPTGDDLTGLLELPGDTLGVFGRRAVRKITGYTDADFVLGTIAAKSGCFDYTAVLVGASPVYTGPNGVTTLEQAAEYGDFVGQTVTSAIASWLRPKLTVAYAGFELGGAAMAHVVRSKNQYRLFLNTGEVISVTFTSAGPTVMFSDYGNASQVKVPFAWSSEMSRANKERIFVVWDDADLDDQTFEIDSGWGFDGKTFTHFYDTAHVFGQGGSVNMGIERIRLHGQGYGAASINIKSSGIEDDYLQEYHDRVQDISIPRNIDFLYNQLTPVTNIIDQANWGLGVKLRVQSNYGENEDTTEPPHICQAFILHIRSEGIRDA